MSKLIVTGVDGNFGGYVARNIIKLTGKENLIFTCPFEEGLKELKEQGYDCRVANFNHVDGLEKAFEGGDAILIISSPFVGEKRRNAHKNAVDAAKKAGVKKVVYTSLVNAQDEENPSIEKIDHAYTENYIINSGLDFVFLRNSQYAEAMITSYFTAPHTGNMMLSCQGDGHMSYISRRDCAKAGMYALYREDLHYATLNINGPESMTLNDFVEAGNKASGLNIGVKNVTEEETYAAFDAMGVPRNTDGDFKEDSAAPYSSDGMVTFARAIRFEKMSTHTEVFEWLTGDKPRTVLSMFENSDEYQVGARNSTDD